MRGFSLIELIVVIAIVAVVMAIAYPGLAPLATQYRLDSAAWTLATDLQKVRLRAIGEGVRFRVTFNPSAKTYQVGKETSLGSNSYANDGGAKQISSTDAVAVNATGNPTFNTRGTAETAATITLGTTPNTRTILVQSQGRVNVQ